MKRPTDKRMARPVKLHEIPFRQKSRLVGMVCLSRHIQLDVRGETSYKVFTSRRLPHDSRTAMQSSHANKEDRLLD